jgi:hypothetical protein
MNLLDVKIPNREEPRLVLQRARDQPSIENEEVARGEAKELPPLAGRSVSISGRQEVRIDMRMALRKPRRKHYSQ